MPAAPVKVWVINALLVLTLLAAAHGVMQAASRENASACSFQGPLAPEQPVSAPPPAEQTSAAESPAEPLPPALHTPASWRLGFGVSSAADPALWAGALGAGWYLDWAAARRPQHLAPEHWQIVRLSAGCTRPTAEEASRLALRYPGRTWVIGNEPDVIWQDNVTPERYAELYHEFYQAIKAADPSAQVAVAGVSQPTPLRLDYLDLVLQAYQELYGEPLPVDVWTVHNFVLREQRDSWGAEIPPGMTEDQGQLVEVADHGRLDLFEGQLRAFRDWMARRGYRERPLAVTEFGILMPPEFGFTPDVVEDYLRQTFFLLDTLCDEGTGYPDDENRLVQRWAWFSLADELYPTGDLADLESQRLTSLGWAFREVAQSVASP